MGVISNIPSALPQMRMGEFSNYLTDEQVGFPPRNAPVAADVQSAGPDVLEGYDSSPDSSTPSGPDKLEGYSFQNPTPEARPPSRLGGIPSSFVPPTYRPFAGGSVGMGALAGGLLGATDVLSGKNNLHTAIGMPGEQYARELHSAKFGSDMANAQAENDLRRAQAAKAWDDINSPEKKAREAAQTRELEARANWYGERPRTKPLSGDALWADVIQNPDNYPAEMQDMARVKYRTLPPAMSDEQKRKLDAQTAALEAQQRWKNALATSVESGKPPRFTDRSMAMAAIDDPNATDAHKRAANIFLGLEGRTPATKETRRLDSSSGQTVVTFSGPVGKPGELMRGAQSERPVLSARAKDVARHMSEAKTASDAREILKHYNHDGLGVISPQEQQYLSTLVPGQ